MSNDQKLNFSQPNSNEDQIAIVGKNFIVKGDLNGAGAAIISGKIEGNISAKQVIIEQGASVLGNITCHRIDISGHVHGLTEAAEVIVRQTALIEGDLNYSTLAIENGGVVTGKLKQAPAKPTNNAADGGLKNFQSNRNQPDSLTRIAFPVDLSQKLRLHESRALAHLSLVDGTPTPAWINLTSDKLGLMVNSSQLKELEKEGLKLEMRLHVGKQYFDFNLPLQN